MNATLLSTLSQPQWLIPLALAAWLLGSALMSRIAGWAALAVEHAASGVPEGQVLRFVSGSVGSVHWPVRYRHCLSLVVTGTGLYIRPMFPFRFGSRALLIPWHAVESVQEKQLFSTRVVTFRIRGHWPAITLPGPVGQLALQVQQAATASP